MDHDDLLLQARAAVAAGDRAAALRLLALIVADSPPHAAAELGPLLGDALVGTAAAHPAAEDAAAIAAYRQAEAALDEVLRLIARSQLDRQGIAAIRLALSQREAELDWQERQELQAALPNASLQPRRVGRGWVEAKLIRGFGPYLYARHRDGRIQRSKYLGKPDQPPQGL